MPAGNIDSGETEEEIRKLFQHQEKMDKKNIETIVCAAIWYPINHKFDFQPENIEKGLVICGLRHANCVFTKAALHDLIKERIRVVKPIEGFLTSKNRFVNRFDAMRIARMNKQVEDPLLGKELCSEDLY